MNFITILIILLIFSAVVESTIPFFPLVLALSIMVFLLNNSNKILFIIFLSALMLDALRVGRIGESTLFIFVVLLLIDIFKNIFEFKDTRYTGFSMLISILVFAGVFQYNFVITLAISISTFVILLFLGNRVLSSNI